MLNSSDVGAVQFALDGAGEKGDSPPLHVTRANVLVLVRVNRAATPGRRSKTPNRVLRPRRRRLIINVYSMSNSTEDDDEKGGGPIAYLSVFPRRTRWERVLLPTSVVQAAIDSDERVLRLRIVCHNCRDGDAVVTAAANTAAAVEDGSNGEASAGVSPTAPPRQFVLRSLSHQTKRKRTDAKVEGGGPGGGGEGGGGGGGGKPCLIVHVKTRRIGLRPKPPPRKGLNIRL